MTNAQKWVAAFLGLFLIIFLIGRFTQKDEMSMIPEDNAYMGEENKEQSNKPAGLVLIEQNGCQSCHGEDFNGTTLAPALASLKDHWDRDGLINYLRNPSSYSGDKRFEAYKAQYRSIMPSYGNVDVKDLGKIADFLLTK
ncbi:MAG: cytochrome c [Melioribacteraceae bacterium]|nr:cytochrome c [Melioribacteraceae bacterium]